MRGAHGPMGAENYGIIFSLKIYHSNFRADVRAAMSKLVSNGWSSLQCRPIVRLKSPQSSSKRLHSTTRKPCYRKDDRAMRPIYGCPEKLWESSQTPPATFPEICKGFLFRSILRMCIQNLKFIALSVPEIIGGTQKIWAVTVYAHAPVSHKFLMGFCLYGPSEYICQIWSS